jgi:hypothetical protein
MCERSGLFCSFRWSRAPLATQSWGIDNTISRVRTTRFPLVQTAARATLPWSLPSTPTTARRVAETPRPMPAKTLHKTRKQMPPTCLARRRSSDAPACASHSTIPSTGAARPRATARRAQMRQADHSFASREAVSSGIARWEPRSATRSASLPRTPATDARARPATSRPAPTPAWERSRAKGALASSGPVRSA